MENVAVIGLGNLGKRHLQSLLEYGDRFNTYGVEGDANKIATLKDEYPGVDIYRSIEELPKKIDLCVIATSSEPRRAVFEQLVEYADVDNIIFEKVLFQKSSDYSGVRDIIHKEGINAWVNCARREWASYKELKEHCLNEKWTSFTVTGGEWGLCCNGIHMIDLMQYMSGVDDIIFDKPVVIPNIFESKREGYKEMYGTIIGHYGQDGLFQIMCTKDYAVPMTILMNGENTQLVIEESKGKLHVAKREAKWEWETRDFAIEYQSGLTGRVAKDILDNGNCNLATYDCACDIHTSYINMWLDEFKKRGWEEDICPIT